LIQKIKILYENDLVEVIEVPLILQENLVFVKKFYTHMKKFTLQDSIKYSNEVADT